MNTHVFDSTLLADHLVRPQHSSATLTV